jgi:TctA family transporter
MIAVPYHFLFPAILAFCVIGVFSLGNSTFDVYVLAGFGVLGYLFRKLDCEPAPMLLAFILGPMMEEQLRRAMLLAKGDPTVFVTRPISGAMIVLAIVLFAIVLAPAVRRKREEAFTE